MPFGPRLDLLVSQFERFGVPKTDAATLSSEVVLRHPLVHRVGVPGLARRFERHGVAPEDARHLALTLWGLERLLLGACFQDMLDALRRAGVAEAEAYPACVEARRLWCEGTNAVAEEEVDLQLARWCLAFLATLALVGALLQLGG